MGTCLDVLTSKQQWDWDLFNKQSATSNRRWRAIRDESVTSKLGLRSFVERQLNVTRRLTFRPNGLVMELSR